MENKSVDVKFQDLLLKSAYFKRSSSFDSKAYSIELQDSLSVSDVSATGFVVSFERKTLSKEPFEVSVAYDVKVIFENDSQKAFGEDVNKIKEFANKKAAEIVSSLAIPARASVLIGSMTQGLGTPYVSIPRLVNTPSKVK